MAASTSFEAAYSHPIVKAFEAKRTTNTGTGKTVGPAAGEMSFHHLGLGNDHRGATWFQSASNVVWLCAYRFHRSGSDDDFFKWVKPLIQCGALLPSEADIRALVQERRLRFRDMAPVHARALIEESRQSGAVATGRLAWEVDVRVKAEPGDEELVSVGFAAADGGRSNEIVSAFDPMGHLTPDWHEGLPGEAPVSGEIAFTVLRPAV